MSDTERKSINDAVDTLTKLAKTPTFAGTDHSLDPVIDAAAVLTKQFFHDLNRLADASKSHGSVSDILH
jgi:hypothetical protein